MTKSELRKIYKQKRSKFSQLEIENSSLKILSNLKKMDIWDNSIYHIFVPIISLNELNTFPIIQHLFALNKTVVVPKITDGKMISCKISPDVKWETGLFDVPEPVHYQSMDDKKIDVVFVPMLICDKLGNRIGYGAGFYDRFLVNCKPMVKKIGLNLFPPIDSFEGLKNTDVPLDYCVTEEGILSFSS